MVRHRLWEIYVMDLYTIKRVEFYSLDSGLSGLCMGLESRSFDVLTLNSKVDRSESLHLRNVMRTPTLDTRRFRVF